MATKKKQEERHLQILKELSQIQCNKSCFECGQRGPMYIDITIGSFVCSSCGGILRGLSNPHRVKSLSMSTFSPTEVALIEQRGNAYCKTVYLGGYDDRCKAKPNSKDHSKLKHFMEQKYEQKRWYVSPKLVNQPLQSFLDSHSKKTVDAAFKSTSTSTNTDNLSTASSTNPIQLKHPEKGPSQKTITSESIVSIPSTDGFADFTSAFSTVKLDPFGTDNFSSHLAATTTSSAFSTSFSHGDVSNVVPTSSNDNVKPSTSSSKSDDKYADLADLFNTVPVDSIGTQDLWKSNTSAAISTNNLLYGMSNAQSSTGPTPSMTSVYANSQPVSIGGGQTVQASGVFNANARHPVYTNAAPHVMMTSYQQPVANMYMQPVTTFTGQQILTPVNMIQPNMQTHQPMMAVPQANTLPAYGNSNMPTTYGSPQPNVNRAVRQSNPFAVPVGQQQAPQYSSNPFMATPAPANPFTMQPIRNHIFVANSSPQVRAGNPFY